LRCTSPKRHVQHKSQRPTYITNSRTLEIISILVGIACATSKIETLEFKQPKRTQSLRPQLHVILRSEPGSFKSTILESVGRKFDVTPYSNVTYPAMIGTIDQLTGRPLPGLVWQTRNKPLLLDEFKTGERGDSAAVDVLLGAMEGGHYKRKIGLRSEDYREEDGSLFYRVENGEIEVKTRFSSIIATMKNWDMNRSGKYEALSQRCIPVRYTLGDRTIDDVLDGAEVYRHHEYHPPRQIVIGRRDFLKIRELAAQIREKNDNFRSVYTRTIGDICRILAVTARFDPELFRLVCYLKARLPLEQAHRMAQEEE